MTYLEYRYIFCGFCILSVLLGVTAVILLFRLNIIGTVAYLTGITRKRAMAKFRKDIKEESKIVPAPEPTGRLQDEEQTLYMEQHSLENMPDSVAGVEVYEEVILINDDYY